MALFPWPSSLVPLVRKSETECSETGIHHSLQLFDILMHSLWTYCGIVFRKNPIMTVLDISAESIRSCCGTIYVQNRKYYISIPQIPSIFQAIRLQALLGSNIQAVRYRCLVSHDHLDFYRHLQFIGSLLLQFIVRLWKSQGLGRWPDRNLFLHDPNIMPTGFWR